MKVLNVHSRVIECQKSQIDQLLETLTSQEDKVWPSEQWPKMFFKDGFKLGSKGGHGPIRYTITQIKKGELLEFKFTSPQGFDGHHRFEMSIQNENQQKLKHTIDMNTRGLASLKWLIVIRPLHDALIEDLLDKIETQLTDNNKKSQWSLWVRFLRMILR